MKNMTIVVATVDSTNNYGLRLRLRLLLLLLLLQLLLLLLLPLLLLLLLLLLLIIIITITIDEGQYDNDYAIRHMFDFICSRKAKISMIGITFH